MELAFLQLGHKSRLEKDKQSYFPASTFALCVKHANLSQIIDDMLDFEMPIKQNETILVLLHDDSRRICDVAI
jgi:hypothetical protein